MKEAIEKIIREHVRGTGEYLGHIGKKGAVYRIEGTVEAAAAIAELCDQDKADALEALGEAWQEIADKYEARLAETEQALRHLRNEAHGVVHTWRYELAELAGETNVACLLRRIQEADKALAAGEGRLL